MWFDTAAIQDHREIAKDPDMTEATIKVLMHLSGKLDFENFTQQNQMDIAKELGYAKKRITHYTLTNFQADRT